MHFCPYLPWISLVSCGNSNATGDNATHSHAWKDATCIEPKTCTQCGATEGEKLPEPTPEPTPDTDISIEKNHKECEAPNAFEEFLNALINFFRRLFGLPEICFCGEEIIIKSEP